MKIPVNISCVCSLFKLHPCMHKINSTASGLTADVQLQRRGTGASLVEGVAAVSARVRQVDGFDRERDGSLATTGTG